MLLILFIIFFYRHLSSVTEETSQTLLSSTRSFFLPLFSFSTSTVIVHMQKTCFQARLFSYTVLDGTLMQCYTVLDGTLMQCYTVLDGTLMQCYTVLDGTLMQCSASEVMPISSVKSVTNDCIGDSSKYGNAIPCHFCNTNVLNVTNLTKSAVQMSTL